MNLLRLGDFPLRSGRRSAVRIECGALPAPDWQALGFLAARLVGPFGRAEGVPRGGLPLAEAMRPHADPASEVVCICEDVVTTGGSMGEFLRGLVLPPGTPYVGVAAFARGPLPGWVKAVFPWPRELWDV